MTAITKLLASSVLCLSLSAPLAVSQSTPEKQATSKDSTVTVSSPARIRLGFSLSAGYSRFSGGWPYYYYRYPYTYAYGFPWYYDSFYFAPMYPPIAYFPGWATGFERQSGMGEIRLQCNVQDADVYVNDGFAGKAKDLRTMWLDPGAYDLKIEAEKHAPFTIRVYILSDKTVKIDARLGAQKEPL